MLVLSRKKDESIVIGDNIEIVVVDVRGDKVRLGITAPKEISVHRREIYDAIQREKKEKERKELKDKQASGHSERISKEQADENNGEEAAKEPQEQHHK